LGCNGANTYGIRYAFSYHLSLILQSTQVASIFDINYASISPPCLHPAHITSLHTCRPDLGATALAIAQWPETTTSRAYAECGVLRRQRYESHHRDLFCVPSLCSIDTFFALPSPALNHAKMHMHEVHSFIRCAVFPCSGGDRDHTDFPAAPALLHRHSPAPSHAHQSTTG
jgi:hypothetical protein